MYWTRTTENKRKCQCVLVRGKNFVICTYDIQCLPREDPRFPVKLFSVQEKPSAFNIRTNIIYVTLNIH